MLLVLSPFGGGAIAATSTGTNGDVVYANAGTIYRLSGTAGTPQSVASGVDPSWSPNGLQLALAANAAGTGPIETCSMSAACSPAAVPGTTGREPVWSPDGSKIAYVSGTNIHTVTSSGLGDTVQVAGRDPSWDPEDPTQLAYSDGSSIFICTVTALITCSSSTGSAIVSGTHPAWSPDGKEIAYVDGGGGISVVVLAGLTTSSVAATGTTPSWSPEQDTLLYSDASGIEVATFSGSSWSSTAITGTAGGTSPDRQTLAPVAGTQPAIIGAAQTGAQLQSSTGSWIGTDPTRFPYQYTWKRCDSSGNNCNTTVAGPSTANTYAPVSLDVGSRLVVIVTGRNQANSTQSSASVPTAIVVAAPPSAPVNTSYPVITLPFTNTTGVPNTGDTLSTSNGTWTGSFPMTFTYQWKKCDSPTGSCYTIPGATHSTFTITGDLYQWSIRAEVTATNGAAAVAQNSEATKLVSAIPPNLRVTPQITGTVMVDQTLSIGTGTWDGSAPLTFKYEWRRCNPPGDLTSCVPISGATSATYVPVVADIGQTLRVWITGSNPAGSQTWPTNHTFPVVDKPHFAPTAGDSPLIVGTLEVGGILTASIGTFTGDSPIVTKQQWQRCDATGSACKDIKNATKQVYHPVAADIGSTLRLVVTATNAYGKALSISDVTEPVIPQLPHIKGETIIGSSKNDYLIGTIHDDVINGNGGNDTINGDGGYDTINGGSGNDVINVPGPGRSKINGGSGSDTIYAANGEKDTIDCGSGNDRAVIDAFDVVHNCEVVQVGSSGSGSGSGSGS